MTYAIAAVLLLAAAVTVALLARSGYRIAREISLGDDAEKLGVRDRFLKGGADVPRRRSRHVSREFCPGVTRGPRGLGSYWWRRGSGRKRRGA